MHDQLRWKATINKLRWKKVLVGWFYGISAHMWLFNVNGLKWLRITILYQRLLFQVTFLNTNNKLVFNWNHFEMRLLNLRINFYLLRTFCPHLGSFLYCFFFHYVSAKFHLWLPSGDFTATSDRNAESCNRIPVITALSIAPRFWPSKPLAGRIWNRYLLTMLTGNRRDSTPLSAAPRAPKCDQGLIFWSYKSLFGLP